MTTPDTKEVKPCWKCGLPLTINEYGYAICYARNSHISGSEAVVFGEKNSTEYKLTEPSPEYYKKIDGNSVLRIRKSLGESQTQFAQHFNVRQVTVSAWETNKVKPPQKVLTWQLTPGAMSNESQQAEQLANPNGDYTQTDGYKIQQLRARLGETQTQFAQHFNVNQSVVSRWERNILKPTQEVLTWQPTPNDESQAA